jgi:hypothetical protein
VVLGEIPGPLLESKVSLIREEGHVCTKETWITEWLLVSPRVVTPKLHKQLAVMISILTDNDQLYNFLALTATFRSYGQTVSKAGQSSWAGTEGPQVLQISSSHLQMLCVTMVTCSKFHTDTKQHLNRALWYNNVIRTNKIATTYINDLIQIYCLLHVSNNNCSSSERLVHVGLCYFFHPSIRAV